MIETKRLYVRLGVRDRAVGCLSVVRAGYWLLLSLGNLLRAAVIGGPGVGFHLATALRAVRLMASDLPRSQVFRLMGAPMDSFRYFEYDFFWKRISGVKEVGDYLDVSSPRLLTWRALCSGRVRRAVITNPDRQDLAITAGLLAASACSQCCEFRPQMADELADGAESFDMVVSISVLEHIPAGDAEASLRRMWQLVKPGGRLLLSVPCAREAFEEYVDFNEYGLLEPEAHGFVFGQRFYDQRTLEEEIYSVVGSPTSTAIYGEKVPGAFVRDRERKLTQRTYPFWRESWMMATEYRYFEDLQQLPGLGVIAFEFMKR